MKLRKLVLLLAAWPAFALAGSPVGVLPQIAEPKAERPGNPALPRPLIAPPSSWVDVAPLPKPPSGSEGAATIDLLGDVQVLFGKEEETTYYAAAWVIGTAHGLDSGSLKIDWDPSLEVVTIHRYRVLRDGQLTDLLGDGSQLKVIQRETRMESAMLDGRLTATLQPEDLRVGDVVELAYSTVRRDPATKGMAEHISGLADGATFGRFRVRMLWSKDKQVQWRALPGILKPKLKKTPQGTELVGEISDMTAPRGPEGAPLRYALVNAVEVTEFKDWQGVSRLFAPIYAQAAQLAPDSKIKAEAAKIAAASPDPKRRAEMALNLVQDQVRYLFLGMDAGGYVPAPAELTWARRFGDCKGKTVLLIALLGQLGIEARPVLVHTEDGDLVASRLPAMGAFDHVIVEAKIGGKSYWLDGTRLGDDQIDRLQPPAFKVGLPVTVQGSPLVPIVLPELTRPATAIALAIDASKGLVIAAPVSGEMRFSGVYASDVRQKFAGLSQTERNRELRRIWRESFDMVTPVKVGTVSDPETGDFVLMMSGTALMDWTADLGTRWYEIDRSRLGWRIDIAREGEINPDAPYAFNYPDWWSSRVTITLPHAGKGFRVQGSDPVDKTIGDLFHFRRKVAFKDGVVTMDADTRALAAELPAARAPRTRAEMVEMSNGSVYIRAPADYEPTEAEMEQSRRADAAEAEAAKAKAKGKAAK